MIRVAVREKNAGKRRIGTVTAKYFLKQRRGKPVKATEILRDTIHQKTASRIFQQNTRFAERGQLQQKSHSR